MSGQRDESNNYANGIDSVGNGLVSGGKLGVGRGTRGNSVIVG